MDERRLEVEVANNIIAGTSRLVRTKTIKRVEQSVARGTNHYDENDDKQKEVGLRRKVKIVKKYSKRYNGSGFILVTKFSAVG